MKNRLKFIIPCVLVVAVSCKGKLPDNEIQAYKNEMEERKIKRITETEIAEAAQKLMDSLKTTLSGDTYITTELYKTGEFRSETEINDEKVKMIFEAYQMAPESQIDAEENFQKMVNENYILTIPEYVTDSSGAARLSRVKYLEIFRTELIKQFSKSAE